MDLTVENPPDKRTKTVQELYTSEQIYVSNLRAILEGFINPLKQNQLVPSSTISGIFSNIETILRFHENHFFPEIEKEIKSWTEVSVLGNLFFALSPCFKLYTIYCSNYDKAIALVQEHKKENPQFAQFLADAQNNDLFHGSYITSMLILPIQRIPRYEMFLQQLVKQTPEDHPDYESLKTALASVETKATQVNEACEKAENILKVIEIAKVTGRDNLLVPGRCVVREDNLHEVKQDGSSTVPTKCYLFNDLIILFNEKKTKRNSYTMKLEFCWVRDLEHTAQSQLVTMEGNFRLLFPSEAVQSDWVRSFNQCLRGRLTGREGKKLMKLRAQYHIVDSESTPGYFTLINSEATEEHSPVSVRRKNTGTSSKKTLINQFKAMTLKRGRKQAPRNIEDIFGDGEGDSNNESDSPETSSHSDRRKSLPHTEDPLGSLNEREEKISSRFFSNTPSQSDTRGARKNFRRSASAKGGLNKSVVRKELTQ